MECIKKMEKKRSLTAKQILSLLQKNQETLQKYSVKKIGLFGSYATGSQRQRSDIDFLVDFEKPTFDNFMGLVFYLEKLFGKKVDLITDGNLSPYIKPYVEKEVRWHEV